MKDHILIAAIALAPLGLQVLGDDEKSSSFQHSVAAALQQAHTELWNDRIDQNGVILDYIGEIPTPEDCSLGKPNAIGWRSPIANGPMFTGLYLPAMCERARRSGSSADRAKAQRLAQGLLKCASVSDVRGFIARGTGTDGTCHYPIGSDDQTHPWFYGLHAYYHSSIPSRAERKQIASKMVEVADALDATDWKCPCDGAFKGQTRGSFRGHLFRDSARFLFLLRAMYDVTRDNVWLERYRAALTERPGKGGETRAQICAEGYVRDREAIEGIDEIQQWIYIGAQGSLAKLIAMETDVSLREQYRAGLEINATNSLASIEAHRRFDNNDTRVFGDAQWRSVYVTWFPQTTQADAEELSRTGDRVKRGQRKPYEQRYMRNPLAAAAIIALTGDGRSRDVVECTLRHYDYSKIHMSEFFFAECAYYSLPANK